MCPNHGLQRETCGASFGTPPHGVDHVKCIKVSWGLVAPSVGTKHEHAGTMVYRNVIAGC
jgi:hypothetical protein